MRTRRLTNNHHYGHSFHFPIPPPPPPPHSPTSESKWYSIIFLSRNDVIGHECVTDLCHQYSILLKIYFKKRQKKIKKIKGINREDRFESNIQSNQFPSSTRINTSAGWQVPKKCGLHPSFNRAPASVRGGFTRAPSIRPSGLHPGSVRPSAGASPGSPASVHSVWPAETKTGLGVGLDSMALDSSFQCPYPSATLSRAIKHCGPSLLWFQTIIKYQWSIKTILPVTLKKFT